MSYYYDPHTEIERLFEDVFSSRFVHPSPTLSEKGRTYRNETQRQSPFRPRMDLREEKDANLVTATFELPGLKSEDVAIDIEQNRLTVSGQVEGPHPQHEAGFAVRERRRGKFSRTLQLPVGTKAEEVKAKMENGLLSISFPKVSAEQQPRRIPIQ